jgi:hypothetical protein
MARKAHSPTEKAAVTMRAAVVRSAPRTRRNLCPALGPRWRAGWGRGGILGGAGEERAAAREEGLAAGGCRGGEGRAAARGEACGPACRGREGWRR